MSSNTIARWNAIPLERPIDSISSTGLKRGRPEYEETAGNDDDDDDISLVSRSPSPVPHDAMDIDESSIHKYDEYVRRPTREVITVETKIKPTNKGFALLAKLGWKEGQPVGLSGEGRTEPIPFHVKSDLTGLGKMSQDVRMIEETVSQRRELEAERQQKESEEQRKQREDIVARKNALESEISSTLRAFYCTLCDKQFKNVAQYDEHTNSYAHHHKARFKDMQANVRLKPKEEIDKRKEKERKREEKELRKIAAANGIKMPKVTATLSSAVTLAPVGGASGDANNMELDGMPVVEPKISNWGTISTIGGQSGPKTNTSSSGGGGFNKGGWATVGPSSSTNSSTPPSGFSNSRFGSATNSKTAESPNPAGAGAALGHNPTFRNAGWTSLDTGSSLAQNLLPSPPAGIPTYAQEPAPPPPAELSREGWAKATTSIEPALLPPPPEPSRGGWTTATSSSVPHPPPPSDVLPLSSPPPLPPMPQPPPPENKPARSNWQQFQKGIGKRR